MPLEVQMRDSCDPGGYRMVRGWRYTYQTLSNECASSCCARAFLHVCAMHPFCILWVCCASLHPAYLFWHLLLCLYIYFVPGIYVFPFFLSFFFFIRSRWSFVDVPLIFSYLADHVPDWQPRILLGMVKTRSVIVNNTHTHTVSAVLPFPLHITFALIALLVLELLVLILVLNKLR